MKNDFATNIVPVIQKCVAKTCIRFYVRRKKIINSRTKKKRTDGRARDLTGATQRNKKLQCTRRLWISLWIPNGTVYFIIIGNDENNKRHLLFEFVFIMPSTPRRL